MSDGQPRIAGIQKAVNYGFHRVRMMSPVRAGSRLRGRFLLSDVVDRGPGAVLVKSQMTVEIEGGDKPALAAESLGLTRFA
jgi:acyl dehydratase